MGLTHILFLSLFLFLFQVRAILEEDKRSLLEFISKLPHSRSLNWEEKSSVCYNWTGVTCDPAGLRVTELHLPAVGFHGRIPEDTIGRLSAIQTLSLRSNGISGPFPTDLYNLKDLSFLHLQFNKLSGPLPLNLSIWKNLTVINLSNNHFNGSLPLSISNLKQLTTLNLANNSFSGQIPDFDFPNLLQINLSYNKFTGIIPKSLKKFPFSALIGNDKITFPHSTPVNYYPPNQKSKIGQKMSETTLWAIISIVSVVALVVFSIVVLICCLRRRKETVFSGKLEKAKMSPEKNISLYQETNNKVVFFEGCNYVFDLEDLLRASAEVLGKGTFGMAYKAILEDSNVVTVKRLKEICVGKREFEQQMEIVGSVRHENVVELRAYYYSKDEKLLVYDYYPQGSIGAMLHGKGGEDKVLLDWETRLRIALGAAKGLTLIHSEQGGKFIHGNIKSSNIFLNSQNFGCVSDLGLSAIMGPLGRPSARASGYRAPEVRDSRKPSQPSDVYSFGVVLLELLTGKSPIHAMGSDDVILLVRWVHSVVREEWTAEVFDVELLRYPNIEEELVEMLQIALSCVARVPEQRPKLADVAKMIEGVRTLSGG